MLSRMSLMMTTASPTYDGGIDDEIEVLYLEDDPDFAEMYRLKLQLDGYRVHLVPLGSVPPASIGGPIPELLFVDTRGGIRRALQSLATWRADPRFRNTPAIIISNVNAGTLREQGVRLSPVDQLLVIAEPTVIEH